MGRTYDTIGERMATWVEEQPVLFVATAPLAAEGHINCSPKGNRRELKVLDERTVAYVDQTGSGVETMAHLRENARIVLMWCAFEGPARIVRFHGTGRAHPAGDPHFERLAAHFPTPLSVGTRSIVEVTVSRISESCGFGVPEMPFSGHRDAMDDWARRKGASGISDYWSEKNAVSLDGLPGMPGPVS